MTDEAKCPVVGHDQGGKEGKYAEKSDAMRAFANSDEPTPGANRELLATGIATAGGAILGAMSAGGGTSQTAVNRLAGARTQVAELVTAAAATATLLLLGPVIALMPQAALRLAPGGALLVEIGAGQAEDVARLMEETGLTVARPHRRDLAGIERVVRGCFPRRNTG